MKTINIHERIKEYLSSYSIFDISKMIFAGDIGIGDYIQYMERGNITYRMHSALLMKHYKKLCPLNDMRVKHILKQYELYDTMNDIHFSEEAKNVQFTSVFKNLTHMNNYIANFVEIPDFVVNTPIPVGGPFSGTLYEFLEMDVDELESYEMIESLITNLRYLRLINIHGLYTETHIINLNAMLKYVFGCEEMLDACSIASSKKLYSDFKNSAKK